MERRIRYDASSDADDWRSGHRGGTTVDGDALVIGEAGPGPDEETENAFWGSPVLAPGFRFTELVASWSAVTPPGSWIEVRVIGGDPDRPRMDNHLLAEWSSGERPTRRKGDGWPYDDEVAVDVWRPSKGADTYRLAVQLFRRLGSPGPVVHSLGAVATAGPVRAHASSPLGRAARVLDVPRLSQMTWRDAGGAGWCSPTAVSMVLAHAGKLPLGVDLPAAAREVFDPAYDGTGNWPFNTAWAATLTDHAFVTRLHDLRDVERFVEAGIPLVASVAYPEGALTGAPVRGTDGHLLVICGFTETGDVVVNDPAAGSSDDVRRTYDRAELERAWLRGSGGLVYVIHDDDHPLPPRSGGAW